VKYEFSTPEPPKLRVGIASGRVEIETDETDETVVDVEALRGDVEDLRVEQRGREIVVEHRRRLSLGRDEFDVRIRAPHGADAELNVASADARARGRLGTVEVNTASGDVEIEHVAGDARVHAASGDVRFDSVGGKVDVHTASGDIELKTVGGHASVRTASGDVAVGEAAAGLSVHTASGDQTIGSVAQGSVDLKSASGDVTIGIKQGSRLWIDARSMSGDTSSELEIVGAETSSEGPLVELRATSMSGDIRVVRAV
jgi:DUF4097 and DUF4098 domain-containing protein YvlB